MTMIHTLIKVCEWMIVHDGVTKIVSLSIANDFLLDGWECHHIYVTPYEWGSPSNLHYCLLVFTSTW